MTNVPFDLSFLDKALIDFERNEMRSSMDRIESAIVAAFKSLDGEVAYKDFWLDKSVNWRDTQAGVTRFGSMLHDWLQKEGVIDKFDAEANRYEPLPPKTKEFIKSTQIIIKLAMALGAVLATRRGSTHE